MKKFLLFGLCIVVLNSFSQITITSGDFPEGGDTALVSVSSDFELDFATTGTDFLWNYEAMTMDSQRIDTFFDVSDASLTYQLVFNNIFFEPDYKADYYTPLLNFAFPETDLVPISNPVGFTKIESDRVEAVGVGLEISGIKVPVKNEIIDVEYELPMNYGDDWESISFFEVDLNPAFDGILRRHQSRNAQVDGWGQLITPFGSFDVVRTFAVLEFTDSIRIPFGDDGIWIELPTPDQVVYSWWTTDQKVPVLQVVAQDILGTETITSVEYKDRYLGDVSLTKNELNKIEIFPNPASDYVQVTAKDNIDFIEIYSASGALVKTLNSVGDSENIDLSRLQNGVYILKVGSQNQVITQQLVVE